MALKVVCASALVLLLVLAFGVVAHQNNRGRANEIPQLPGTLSSEDIRRSQRQFFHLLEHTPGLKESTNVSTTIQILNTVEGQKLMRALVDSLVPTIGRDDSSELLHNFWLLLSEAVPAKVAHKLKQIEDLYGEIDSLPTALFTLVTAGDKSPIALILQEVIPNFNASELLQSITPTVPSDLSNSSFGARLLHLIKPAIDTFLKENDIDLQTDAILQMITSLTSQFEGPEKVESKTSVGKVKEKSKEKNNANPLAALIPLLGMMGKSQGKNGNKLMEGFMGMMSNGGGENMIENIFSMLGTGGEKNNIVESVMGLWKGGKEGDNNIVESVLGMLNGGSKSGENNIAESVLGMLNGGGKTGDSNLMGMAMTLMNGMNKNKKQNDNLDMIASVVSLMSAADGGGDDAPEKNPMAGIAKMALNMLNQGSSKKTQKYENSQRKKTINKEDKPYDDDAARFKKQHKKQGSSSNNPRSRLLQVLEPALLQLHTDAACHAKLGAVLSAGKTLLDTKAMGAKAFLMAAVPIAVAGLPGGPALLQEFGAALNDLGLKDREPSEVFASISDEGECVTLARRAAPHLAKLVLLLAEPDVQATVWAALTEQTTAALEGLGLKGVTLSNWPQILGPMITMGAAGLPIQPVVLLSALQDHVSDLLRNTSRQLQQMRGLPLKEVVPKLEYELGSLLHHLGNVEHHLSRREGHDTSCIAQVVCKAAQREAGLKAAILTSYSTARAVSSVSSAVPARLEVLRAAAFSGDCETAFPCAPLPAHDSPSARHANLDYDDAAAHVEL